MQPFEMDAGAAALLEERGVQAHQHYLKAHTELLRVIAEQVQSGLWKARGARTPAIWVARAYGLCRNTALEWVRQAEALAERPAIVEAMESGTVSTDEARSLLLLSEGDAADAVVWLEVRETDRLSPDDLRFEARKAVSIKCTATGKGGYLQIVPSPDESWMDLKGRVPVAEGTELLEILDSRAPAGTRESLMPQARVQALMTIARGETLRSPRRPTLVVHVDEDTLVNAKGPAITHLGTFLSPELARAISCDCHVEHIAERNGSPVTAWPERRVVPPAMRRALTARDNRCRECGSMHDLEAHHITPWWRGGKTLLENLILLCRPCHIHHHVGGVKARPRLTTNPRRPGKGVKRE